MRGETVTTVEARVAQDKIVTAAYAGAFTSHLALQTTRAALEAQSATVSGELAEDQGVTQTE